MQSLFVKYLRIVSLTLIIGIFVASAVVQICIVLLFPAIIIIYFQKFRCKNILLLDWLLMLMFLSGVISVLTSPDRYLSFHSLPRHALLLTAIVYSYIFKIDSTVSVKFIFFIVTIGGMISGSAGIFNYLLTGERAYGLFAGYYTLASLLTFSSLISFGLILAVPSNFKIAIFFSLAIQITAIWLTFTRSAYFGLMLGLIAGVLVYNKVFNKRNFKSKLAPIIITFIIVITITISMFNINDQRINPASFFSGDQNQNDFSSGRFNIYNEAASELIYNWNNAQIYKLLFGNGLNSRMSLYPESSYTSWESDYVETFMNHGAIGLILLCTIYFVFFLSLLETLKSNLPRLEQGLVAGILMAGVGFFVVSFFSSQMIGQNSSAYFAIMIASIEKLKTDIIKN